MINVFKIEGAVLLLVIMVCASAAATNTEKSWKTPDFVLRFDVGHNVTVRVSPVHENGAEFPGIGFNDTNMSTIGSITVRRYDTVPTVAEITKATIDDVVGNGVPDIGTIIVNGENVTTATVFNADVGRIVTEGQVIFGTDVVSVACDTNDFERVIKSLQYEML